MKLVARIVAKHSMDAEEIAMFNSFTDEEKAKVFRQLEEELREMVIDFATEDGDGVIVIVRVEE